MIRDGDMGEARTECEECGREFNCEGRWDVEGHEGYGTRYELHPEETVCPDCKGEGDCTGTYQKVDGVITLVPCSSDQGKTRTYIENDGTMTVLHVVCDECHEFYGGDDE